MKQTLHECKRIDLEFFNDAPIRIISEVTLPCSPETLFRCFDDADAWSEWVDVIKKVEWTSARPFQTGTTRTVDMPGGMVAYEEFLAWDEPGHMAFRFAEHFGIDSEEFTRRAIGMMGTDGSGGVRGARERAFIRSL